MFDVILFGRTGSFGMLFLFFLDKQFPDQNGFVAAIQFEEGDSDFDTRNILERLIIRSKSLNDYLHNIT